MEKFIFLNQLLSISLLRDVILLNIIHPVKRWDLFLFVDIV